ncbi:MAG: hypothetical protein M3069_03435 [Chloroflexota bacterium]|nr:hypothetical protein [Chloroflexota bacterium]
MPRRGQHDQSPGDGRTPFSDQGGPAGRHADTHDVRREQLTNPTGPDPDRDEEFAADIAPDTSAGEPGGHVHESRSAVDDKILHERLSTLDDAELARLSILEPGARLEQGGTYVDLNDPSRSPFKAIGGQQADTDHRYVAKRDTDHELWNQLVGQGREPAIERPSTADSSP